MSFLEDLLYSGVISKFASENVFKMLRTGLEPSTSRIPFLSSQLPFEDIWSSPVSMPLQCYWKPVILLSGIRSLLRYKNFS